MYLYASLITPSPTENLRDDSFSFSFSNCSCSAFLCLLLSNTLMIPRERKAHCQSTSLLRIAQQTWICSIFRDKFYKVQKQMYRSFPPFCVHNFYNNRTHFCLWAKSNHVKRQIFKVTNFYAALSLREKVGIIFYPKAIFSDCKVCLPQKAMDIFRVTHVMKAKGHFTVNIHYCQENTLRISKCFNQYSKVFS